jgi:hypothetical protein
MQPGAFRSPLYAAGLAAILAMSAVGCAAIPGAGGSSAPAPASALAAVRLAAKATGGVNSFTGTLSLQGTLSPGAAGIAGADGGLSMTATFAERLRPTLLVEADIKSYSILGQALPGGLTDLVTPTTIYLKAPAITQELHLTKPWLAIPLTPAGKSSGLNLSQLLNQATGSGPLTQAQMLGASSSVREVGTGSLGGVPVTEYAGTIPVAKAIAGLSGSAKAEMQQLNTAAGITSETYTVWIDGQHIMRKAVIKGTGATLTETFTMTITSVNQPVSIALPPASQTTSVPASALG